MPEILRILLGGSLPVVSAYCLGRFLLRRLPLPGAIALAVGAALLSHLIFLTLLAGAANLWTFLLLAVVTAALGTLKAQRAGANSPGLPHPIYLAIFGAYGVLYFLHALAPEIRSDGYTYHLGLPAEWLRLGSFSGRIAFFEMLPQGLEMLFMFAFALGRHSAAKLVHFAFLAASVPLILSIGRKMRIPNWAAGAAAVLYFCSPVAGTSGTSAYNDAALVFYILAYVLPGRCVAGGSKGCLPCFSRIDCRFLLLNQVHRADRGADARGIAPGDEAVEAGGNNHCHSVLDDLTVAIAELALGREPIRAAL